MALRAALCAAGSPDSSTPEWQTAYQIANQALAREYPRIVADAILWRATFLEALLGWETFQKWHEGEGQLPTIDMLKVAARIETFGDETSFDTDSFEDELEALTD